MLLDVMEMGLCTCKSHATFASGIWIHPRLLNKPRAASKLRRCKHIDEFCGIQHCMEHPSSSSSPSSLCKCQQLKHLPPHSTYLRPSIIAQEALQLFKSLGQILHLSQLNGVCDGIPLRKSRNLNLVLARQRS